MTLIMSDKTVEQISDLKLGVELLKKDVLIAEKMSARMQEAASSFDILVEDTAKIVLIHSEKMKVQQNVNESTTKKLCSIETLITTKIDSTEERLIKELKSYRTHCETTTTALDKRVKILEKAKIIFGALATGFTFCIIYFTKIIDTLKSIVQGD